MDTTTISEKLRCRMNIGDVCFFLFRDAPEPEPVDEGPQEITFEEYKKQLAEKRTKPEFNLRKVDSDKKGLKQLKKPTEEDNAEKSSFFFPKKVIFFIIVSIANSNTVLCI